MLADSEIKQAGARILFPNDPHGAQQLQRLIAQKSINDNSKVVIKHPTISSIVRSAEKLWDNLWQKGNAHIEKLTDSSMTVVVTDFPELVPSQLELISGYITGILDLTGARNIRVTINNKNPNAWKWKFTWK